MTTKTVGHRLADRIARERGFEDLAAWVLELRGARRWTPAPSWESVAVTLGTETGGEITITGAGLQLWFREEIGAERGAAPAEDDSSDAESDQTVLAAVAS